MKIISPLPLHENFNIGIIVSQFNNTITEKLLEGALTRLKEQQFSDEHITIVKVPGAVEIPLMAQHLIKTDYFKAIIALGAVIQGETDHYQYVCQQVSYGCQKISIETETPIIFGVLTTQTEALALARADKDMHNKGREAVDTALSMVSVLEEVENSLFY